MSHETSEAMNMLPVRQPIPVLPTSPSSPVVSLFFHSGITVEVYKWIVLALSISSDFWLRWLVHEA
jgi:hypothetical protein